MWSCSLVGYYSLELLWLEPLIVSVGIPSAEQNGRLGPTQLVSVILLHLLTQADPVLPIACGTTTWQAVITFEEVFEQLRVYGRYRRHSNPPGLSRRSWYFKLGSVNVGLVRVEFFTATHQQSGSAVGQTQPGTLQIHQTHHPWHIGRLVIGVALDIVMLRWS